MSTNARVAILPPRKARADGTVPTHHVGRGDGLRFTNPHPSYRQTPMLEIMKFLVIWSFKSAFLTNHPKETVDQLIPSHKPTWGTGPELSGKIKATWLGHAAFLVELPAPPGAARGARVLFDPVFSAQCSPNKWVGPTRYTEVPCATEEIPAIDAIVLSHNHYDHFDVDTLTTLRTLHNPHIFCPLGNEALLASVGFAPTHAHTLDWWDARALSLVLPALTAAGAPVETSVTITCTPSQHVSNRGLFDRWASLWASWAVEGPGVDGAAAPSRVFFGGDTGYRSVAEGEDEDAVPVNPDFAEIGRVFGTFDLALLPIGAYLPRPILSAVHASPSDSVRIFQDIRAKRALAMHWGTWNLSNEPIGEPPAKLREACEKAGLAQEIFDICGIGETRVF